jgi:hypothetical protein
VISAPRRGRSNDRFRRVPRARQLGAHDRLARLRPFSILRALGSACMCLRRDRSACLSPAFGSGWLVNRGGSRSGREHAKTGLARMPGLREHASLSVVDGLLLGGRDVVSRREEPPRDESGFRARGSNQRFHRLPRHTVLRPLWDQASSASARRREDSHRSEVTAQAVRDTVL